MRVRFLLPLILPLILPLLATCGHLPEARFAKTVPAFDPVTFWAGHHRSWGVLENRGGEPTDTVVTDCIGTPEPNGALHMVQTLTLGDGTVQHRDWHLKRLVTQEGPGIFVATANDMLGEARGIPSGRMFHWTWVLALSPGNFLKNITMDQWMYLMDGGAMMNHTTIRKFGVIVAQVSEVFQIAP